MSLSRFLLCCCFVELATFGFSADPPVNALAFSPDGQTLLACSQNGVAVYEWPSLKLRQVVKTQSPNLQDLVFSPSGNHLAVVGGTPADQGTVELFSWPGCEPKGVLYRHVDSVMSVVWLNDDVLVTAGLDREIYIWDVSAQKVKHRCSGHSRGVRSLVAFPKGDQFVSAGIDNSLRLWDANQGRLVHSLGIHTASVIQLAARPGPSGLPMVASASEDRTVRLWQPTIGRMVRFIRLPSVPLNIAWIASGDSIVAVCTDGVVRVIDPETVEIVNDVKVSDDWITAVATTPSGNEIVVGDALGKIQRVSSVQLLPR